MGAVSAVNHEILTAAADTVLQEVHLSLVSAVLPVLPDVLDICHAGNRAVWGGQGAVSGAAQVAPVPSVVAGRYR